MAPVLLAAINPNIDPEYWWLTALGLPLWGRALWWSVKAARLGIAESVKIRAATAALALIYLVANCVLLFSTVDPAQWSNVMWGFQLLTVPIVWEIPARLAVRMGERIREADMRVVKRYDGGPD